VRKAYAKKTQVNNAPELINDPSYTQVLGMLLAAEEDCERVTVELQDDDEREESRRFTGSWFGGNKHKQPKPKKNEKSAAKPEKKGENTQTEKKEVGFKIKMENVFGSIFTEEEDE
jgi:hypothetical protein